MSLIFKPSFLYLFTFFKTISPDKAKENSSSSALAGIRGEPNYLKKSAFHK